MARSRTGWGFGNIFYSGLNHRLLRRNAVHFTHQVAEQLNFKIRIFRHEALCQTNALVAICNIHAAVCILIDRNGAGKIGIPFSDELQAIGHAELIAAALELEGTRIDLDIPRIKGIDNAAQVFQIRLPPGQDLGRQSRRRAIDQFAGDLGIGDTKAC